MFLMYTVSSCLGGVLLIGLREMKRQRRLRHDQKRLSRAIREAVLNSALAASGGLQTV
jgi:hypothetical protein